MDGLFWQMTINGLPSFDYRPWFEAHQYAWSGLLSWVPKFEGEFDAVVTCTDSYDSMGVIEVRILCLSRST